MRVAWRQREGRQKALFINNQIEKHKYMRNKEYKLQNYGYSKISVNFE